MKTKTYQARNIWILTFLIFIGIYAIGVVEATIEKKAYGYNDTVIILSIVDGRCNAVMYKSDDPKRYTISCEEAKKIILTFPKNGDIQRTVPEVGTPL
jgi:hypothetical protein